MPGTPGLGGPDPLSYDAVVFDMDGVVTDTASVHAAAWKSLFDAVLPGLAGSPGPAFDVDRDYRRHVDGRTREDGVRAFLASRGTELADGEDGDPPDRRTVHGLAARKQELFVDRLAQAGVVAFPSTVALVRRLRAAGVPTGLVTSSRNSDDVLVAAGASGLFDVRVDGSDALRLGLPGKPDPAMFLEAARLLGVDPARAVVVEDAEAGVRAGAAGGFGLVVGVDRTGNRAGLLEAGADVVVDDLAALGRESPSATPAEHWCGGATTASDTWTLRYEDEDPAAEGTREALCTLGNGYWATRGSVPGTTDDGVHYPGTYLAGVYNRLRSTVAGRVVEDEHMVRVPDWTSVTVGPPDGTLFLPGAATLVSTSQQLDTRHGTLTRVSRFRDKSGRTTRVTSRSFVHMTQVRLAVLETTVVAEDWSGAVVVRSGVDGRVANRNVEEYRELADVHLEPVQARQVDPQTVLLEVVTSQSRVHVAMAARTRVRPGGLDAVTTGDVGAGEIGDVARRVLDDVTGYVGQELVLDVQAGQPVTVEKVVAVATSRDPALSTAPLAATSTLSRAAPVEELLRSHRAAWERLWERFGIEVQAGQRPSLTVNLHTFHVLQTVAAAGPDLDAGVPARGLHGEGYRGHVFWDEMFVYPMLTLRRPELTGALLRYRHRRLDEARAAARAAGHRGAVFPWQSGSDGREETPSSLYNLRAASWMPDNSHRQRHVGLAVGYAVWQYYQATADLAFLADTGAELMVEVTRYFASLATYDASADRFDIIGVMGPDEFHDGHPSSPGGGLRNNAYTNVMVAWLAGRTLETLDLLAGGDHGPLWDRLALQPGERELWERLRRRLRVPFHADGVVSQFEGYEDLAEFDWEAYRTRYGDIGRLDLILAAEGDTTNRYRLSKQADVLMLFYLLSAEELRAVLDTLGYALPGDAVRRTVEFYLARTTHGSTLSRLVHGWVLARSDRHRSWSLFTGALDSDLADTQGGTTREGVHIGAMAGTVDMVLRCFSGLETRDGVLRLHPALPPELLRAAFTVVYRGQPVSVRLTRDEVRLHLHPGSAEAITVCVEGLVSTLAPGDVHVVALGGTLPRRPTPVGAGSPS